MCLSFHPQNTAVQVDSSVDCGSTEDEFAYLILFKGFPNGTLSSREVLKHQKDRLLQLLDCTSSGLKKAEVVLKVVL